MALIGGMHSFAGPAVGAIVLKFLEVFLGRYVERWMLVVGAILLVVSLVAPSGLIGLTMPRRLTPGRGKGKPLAVRPEPL
jgi:branched-chain amino acid transport system permease protein